MKTVGVISLGCSKNLVDTEEMLAYIKDSGYKLTNDIQKSEIIIVNTCAFIDKAQEESIDTILECAKYKKQGLCRFLVVSGCLAERYKDKLLHEIPELDAVIGTGSVEEIVNVLDKLSSEKKIAIFKKQRKLKTHKRLLTGPVHSVYLKIAEGCNHSCSYCIIPRLRGPLRSKPIEMVVEEANNLVRQGAKEINLIAQDTTSYGLDLYGKPSLPSLLKKLSKINSLHWLRILYAYPTHVNEQLLSVIAEEEKICNYLDIPLQHVSDRILKEMRRKETKEEIRAMLEKIRQRIPGITLRTTFIVGFPGETEADFNELLVFMEEQQFDWVGVFPYSQEAGTKAARMANQAPERIRQKRYNEAMLKQERISRQLMKRWLGKTVEVIIDFVDQKKKFVIGRTSAHAPEVDGVVYVNGNSVYGIHPGELITAKIIAATGYDLVAEPV
ncbi:MAG: 30S ribosomal protein S12 methylthiotransferase RimO [Dethiobacteria bacterium]|nr:30S ribosomal protein S12 methylthiotransferase RimO [Bacillota bacterium]